MSDDLFTPSIQARPPVVEPPFPLSSMFLPAFFGGPFALLHFAWVSSERLHEPAGRRKALAWLCGVAALAAVVVAVVTAQPDDQARGLRPALVVSGVVAFLMANPVLKPGQRRYEVQGGEFEQIGFGRGLGVCLAYGLATVLVMALAIGMLA